MRIYDCTDRRDLPDSVQATPVREHCVDHTVQSKTLEARRLQKNIENMITTRIHIQLRTDKLMNVYHTECIFVFVLFYLAFLPRTSINTLTYLLTQRT